MKKKEEIAKREEINPKVMMISMDRRLFEEGSETRRRIAQYGNIDSELHIIVFSRKNFGFEQTKIAENVYLYPTNSLTRWFYIFDAIRIEKKLTKRISFDFVTCQDPFETGFVGYRIAKRARIALELQVHVDFLSRYFVKGNTINIFRVFCGKFLLCRADQIRVVSPKIKQTIVQTFQALENKIYILPIFANFTDAKTPNSSRKQALKTGFQKTILMPTRLEKEKNIPLAFRVLKQILKKHPETGLLLVGKGKEDANFKKVAREMALTENVRFIPWSDNLALYYQNASLLLLTSDFEGYGRTLVEASYFGCPIVSTDVGVAGELLQGGEEFLSRVGDADAIATAVSTLLSSQEKRKENILITGGNLSKVAILDKGEYLKRMQEEWQKLVDTKTV